MKGKLIIHSSQIATPKGMQAKFGKDMNELTMIEQGSIVIENGLIEAVGSTDDIRKFYNESEYQVIHAETQCVIPGFVDSHTHFIFGGYRPEEFFMRLNGAAYMDIMNAGGGIQNTVNATRASTFAELYRDGKDRLDSMLSYGITTVEGKSGYGLDLETELRQLKVMRQLNEIHPVDVVATFLGAHAIPPEFTGKNNEYIDFMKKEVLPRVKAEQLAEFCDVFCEDGVFSIEQSRNLLLEAQKLGFALKVHADEIEPIGGAQLAGELKAASADHLLEASDEGIDRLITNGVVATLLPGTAFCLNKKYADARKIIDRGGAVALASDYNPGSCFTNSVPLILALACIHMRMTPEEALTAFTLNGAAAINRAGAIGSIEPGKDADLLLLKYPSYKFLTYHTAVNIVDRVIKKGVVINQIGKEVVNSDGIK